MTERELEWNRLFAYDLPAVRPAKTPHECCDACKEAREIKCVCACGGKNHGAANRAGMEPLDKPLGLDGLIVTITKEAPKPLASQPEILRLDPQVSRELIYIG